MKKIGCVIAYRKNHTNYGTSLVGYALIKKLQQLGYTVEVINYVKRLTFLQKVKYMVNLICCGELKTFWIRQKAVKLKKFNQQYSENIDKRICSVESYKAKKLIPLFKDYVGYEMLHDCSICYDAIVVGSDQVWSPLSLPNKFYNLLFVKDEVRKIAYASSFGVSTIPFFQRKATGAYLNRFHKIGVREQKGKEIVESLSQKKATVVADPTLLLDAKEWENEIKDSTANVNEPYIFCYFLGNNSEARSAAEKIKEQTGLKIITIRHMDEYVPSDELFGDEAPYDVNPNDFVKYISMAKYVCTDSFHCTAFSIQFHRQFLTFYRFSQGSSVGRNSRIDSLFSVLGIDRERIYNGDITKIDNPIDWDKIDANLANLRSESIRFLEDALTN